MDRRAAPSVEPVVSAEPVRTLALDEPQDHGAASISLLLAVCTRRLRLKRVKGASRRDSSRPSGCEGIALSGLPARAGRLSFAPVPGAFGTAVARSGRARTTEATMSGKRKLSEAEREQRRARDREAMKAAAEALLTSEGWQRWVRVRSRNGLARYSISNQLLIAMARPQATFVAGFRAWIELGFCPVKGSKAIRIMAPMQVRERDPQTGEKTDETRVLFKAVSVFDRSQVTELPDREQIVVEPPCEPLTGDSHAHLIEPMVAFAGSLGFAVSFEAIAGAAGGWCDQKDKRIVADGDAPANARLRTLIHECAHAMGIDYRSYSRPQAEVMVETVTLLAASTVGLAVDGDTIPYVSGWGEDGALEAVTEFAETIDQVARRIEDVLLAASEHAASLPEQRAA